MVVSPYQLVQDFLHQQYLILWSVDFFSGDLSWPSPLEVCVNGRLQSQLEVRTIRVYRNWTWIGIPQNGLLWNIAMCMNFRSIHVKIQVSVLFSSTPEKGMDAPEATCVFLASLHHLAHLRCVGSLWCFLTRKWRDYTKDMRIAQKYVYVIHIILQK